MADSKSGGTGAQVAVVVGKDDGWADGSALTAAKLKGVSDLVYSAKAGGHYFVDTYNHRVRLWSHKSNLVSTLGGTGGPGFADGNSKASKFWEPAGLAIDSTDESIIICDSSNKRIRRIKGDNTTTIAGGDTKSFKDGPGKTAQFSEPRGAASNKPGIIYTCDGTRIRKLERKGEAYDVSTACGNATADNVDGVGTAASLYEPRRMAFDPNEPDTMYIACNNAIRKFNVDSKELSTIKTGIPLNPNGITVTSMGHLLVSNSDHCIYLVDPKEGTTERVAGNKSSGLTDGFGLKTQFDTPAGLSIVNDTLYVADSENHRIRSVTDLPAQPVSNVSNRSSVSLPAHVYRPPAKDMPVLATKKATDDEDDDDDSKDKKKKPAAKKPLPTPAKEKEPDTKTSKKKEEDSAAAAAEKAEKAKKAKEEEAKKAEAAEAAKKAKEKEAAEAAKKAAAKKLKDTAERKMAEAVKLMAAAEEADRKAKAAMAEATKLMEEAEDAEEQLTAPPPGENDDAAPAGGDSAPPAAAPADDD